MRGNASVAGIKAKVALHIHLRRCMENREGVSRHCARYGSASGSNWENTNMHSAERDAIRSIVGLNKDERRVESAIGDWESAGGL